MAETLISGYVINVRFGIVWFHFQFRGNEQPSREFSPLPSPTYSPPPAYSPRLVLKRGSQIKWESAYGPISG